LLRKTRFVFKLSSSLSFCHWESKELLRIDCLRLLFRYFKNTLIVENYSKRISGL
jgi:hypothetical protein